MFTHFCFRNIIIAPDSVKMCERYWICPVVPFWKLFEPWNASGPMNVGWGIWEGLLTRTGSVSVRKSSGVVWGWFQTVSVLQVGEVCTAALSVLCGRVVCTGVCVVCVCAGGGFSDRFWYQGYASTRKLIQGHFILFLVLCGRLCNHRLTVLWKLERVYA